MYQCICAIDQSHHHPDQYGVSQMTEGARGRKQSTQSSGDIYYKQKYFHKVHPEEKYVRKAPKKKSEGVLPKIQNFTTFFFGPFVQCQQ